jgi:hypothetical protein
MPERSRALAELLRGLIDYAGLFPPSAHAMSGTVARYADYRRGPDSAALGRLVVPAARLMEWEQAAAALPAASRGDSRWHLTALVAAPAVRELAGVTTFNEREGAGHDLQARVDSIEVKVASTDDIGTVAAQTPPGVEVFYEWAPGVELTAFLAEVGRVRGGAKIRTGGLVPGAVAGPDAVARFVAGCVAASLPFKATAGLHHPVRAVHPLTYELDAPRAVVNGFLNVFVGAALAHAGRLEAADLMPVLEETTPSAFAFSDSSLAWRDRSVTVEQVTNARRLARSFGSCSFEEPIDDLKTLALYV